MSRKYRIDLEISNYNKNRTPDIISSIHIDDIDKGYLFISEKYITTTEDITLCGGQSESEHFEEMVQDIFKANKSQCKVTANYTYLEDLPFTSYDSDDLYDSDDREVAKPETTDDYDNSFDLDREARVEAEGSTP